MIEKGKLEEDAAVRYFTEMVSAVGYLHEQGVVHRDLKLENVLLGDGNACARPSLAPARTRRPRPSLARECGCILGMRADPNRRPPRCLLRCKLCDFGLAHAYDLDASGAVVRVPLKEVCGSKSYCAPEVLAGLGYDGGLADMWSLVRCTRLPAPRPTPHAPPPAALRTAPPPSVGHRPGAGAPSHTPGPPQAHPGPTPGWEPRAAAGALARRSTSAPAPPQPQRHPRQGICLFAMLAGFFPLDEAAAQDWRYAHAPAQPPPPP